MDATKIMWKASANDYFRKKAIGFMFTKGVQALSDIEGVVKHVREYDDFNKDNDPYGEHDFGSFEYEGNKLFWKIDYYDQALEGYCDPLSPDCKRILTILLAEEY